MPPLPPNVPNERRQDCIEHEQRLDVIGAELHKHSGWFKVLGAGVGIFLSITLFFFARFDNKLTLIQEAQTKAAIESSGWNQRLMRCERDIQSIQDRHEETDRSVRGGK
jgi:hypothetical protein